MAKVYEHSKNFQIKYCEANFQDQLKPSVALSYMEEVASSSADELGFGYNYVKPLGYAFFLTNIVCRFLRPIKIGEIVTVKTWPTPPSHVIFGREYQFVSQKGETLLNASSRWCLIEMETGKILPSKMIRGQDYSTYNTSKTMEDVSRKIPLFEVEEGEERFSMVVANSEYDHNMHVNNTRYADYIFNCFSVAELTTKRLTELCISYVKQCKEGDALRFYRKRIEDNSYQVIGKNQRNETVVSARISFVESAEDTGTNL